MTNTGLRVLGIEVRVSKWLIGLRRDCQRRMVARLGLEKECYRKDADLM